MNYEVTFETKVYENDWRIVLRKGYLEKMIKRCNYDFKEVNLIVNNVQDKVKVGKVAEILKRQNIITEYYFVDDYESQVLNYFDLTKASFKGGYYYSISELTGIYVCSTPYLLHFSSDSFLEDNSENWIDPAIALMNNESNFIVANPVWNYNFNEAFGEVIGDQNDFYIGSGFSDQCYLIPVKVFREKIYNEYNEESERYPKYGGELFEKRIDSFMKNNNKLRLTSTRVSYIHSNFPKIQNLSLIEKLVFKLKLFNRI